jgi:hypothetical protein
VQIPVLVSGVWRVQIQCGSRQVNPGLTTNFARDVDLGRPVEHMFLLLHLTPVWNDQLPWTNFFVSLDGPGCRLLILIHCVLLLIEKLGSIWSNFVVVATNLGNIGVVGILWGSNGVYRVLATTITFRFTLFEI